MPSKRRLLFQDLGFAKLDLNRSARRDFPEVIYAKGKTCSQISSIAKALEKAGQPVVITKLEPQAASEIVGVHPFLRYDAQAKMAFSARKRGKACLPRRARRRQGSASRRALVAVVTAGTGDFPVAQEAVLTARLMGCRVRCFFDVGVAGLHRLLSSVPMLRRARVIVVVAGMDGALAGVTSGLVAAPVIAVPTSVGYGASFRGVAPLLTMLNSCSPGVAVVNIDNGFGAGYLAALIAKRS